MTDHVFHRDGNPIVCFKRAWKTATERAGVPGKLFHDCRRTCVRNLVRADVPDSIAMAITGHKTRSVFDRYDIVDEADLLDAQKKLAEHLSDKAANPKVTRIRKA